MTFREKYPQLQDKEFVAEMIINSAHGNMCLEGTCVDLDKVIEMYKELKKQKNQINS